SNFDPAATPGPHPDWVIGPGMSCVITTDPASFNGCGLNPPTVTSSSALIVLVNNFAVEGTGVIRVQGGLPLIIAAYAEARLAGSIDLAAAHSTGGPGS